MADNKSKSATRQEILLRKALSQARFVYYDVHKSNLSKAKDVSMYQALKTPFRVASFTVAGLTLLLSGCATTKIPDIKVWPFGDDAKEVDRTTPDNSTKYVCDAGRKFYVRTLNNGESVWLILTDREFGLDKVASDTGKRYSNGNSVLNINSDEATFDDGPTAAYKGCKVVEVKK